MKIKLHEPAASLSFPVANRSKNEFSTPAIQGWGGFLVGFEQVRLC
jgi:hypothetical protein